MQTPTTSPSPAWSLTDPHTWAALLAVVAAALAQVFHTDLAAYVPAASTVAAAVVVAGVALAKHNLAGSLQSATIRAAAATNPPLPAELLHAATSLITNAAATLTGQPLSASQSPASPEPPAPAPAAPPAPDQAPPATFLPPAG